MRDGIDPRRNWYILRPEGIENTLMIVPLSEAVARSVPVLLIVIHESGERCASTTLQASSLNVSKRRTLPLVGAMCVALGGIWDGGVKEEDAAFWG